MKKIEKKFFRLHGLEVQGPTLPGNSLAVEKKSQNASKFNQNASKFNQNASKFVKIQPKSCFFDQILIKIYNN